MICPAASGCPVGSGKIAFPLLDEGWETGSQEVVEMIQRRTNFVGIVERDYDDDNENDSGAGDPCGVGNKWMLIDAVKRLMAAPFWRLAPNHNTDSKP